MHLYDTHRFEINVSGAKMYRSLMLILLLLTFIAAAFLASPEMAFASDHCDAFLDGCMDQADDVYEMGDCFNGYLACIGYDPPLPPIE
jgi:hypothetical protein